MSEINKKKIRAYKSGLWAETYCAWVLRFKGYQILERRYKCASGEIDLIAKGQGRIVFVEVKYRSTLAAAAHAIDTSQKIRIYKAAQSYLTRAALPAHVVARFDAILVAPFGRIKHIPNAWET